MQSWCRRMVARLRSSNPSSGFSMPLGSFTFSRLAPSTLLSLGLTGCGEASGLYLQSSFCSGTKIWRGSLVSALRESPYCTLEPQPVLQRHVSRGNWHSWGTEVMMKPPTLCWGSLAYPPSALSLQLPYPESSSHSR